MKNMMLRFLTLMAAMTLFAWWFSGHWEVQLNFHDAAIVSNTTKNCYGCYWCYTSGYPTNTTYTFARHIWFYHYGGSLWP